MSKGIANQYDAQNTAAFRATKDGIAVDWRELTEHQNLHWSQILDCWGSHVWSPLATTTSETLTQNNSSSRSRDLDQFTPAGIFERKIGGDQAFFIHFTEAQDATVQVTLQNEETDTQLYQHSTNFSTSVYDRIATVTRLPWAGVVDGSGTPQMCTVRLRYAARDNEALLAQHASGEADAQQVSDLL